MYVPVTARAFPPIGAAEVVPPPAPLLAANSADIC